MTKPLGVGNRSLTRDKGWGIEKPFHSARVPSWPRIVLEPSVPRAQEHQGAATSQPFQTAVEKGGRESRCCAASWTRVQFPGSSTPARSVTGSTGIFLKATRVVACARSLNAARGLESADTGWLTTLGASWDFEQRRAIVDDVDVSR